MVNDPLDVSTWNRTVNGDVWTPRMPGNALSGRILRLEHELQRQRRNGTKKIDTTSGAALKVPAGAPRQIISCQATESAVSQVDRVYSQIAVSFTRDPADPNYAGVHVWVTGYHGNAQPVLVTDAADSPAVFLLETTNEVVTITVQPFNSGHVAAPFAGAKTTKALLNGQTTAPAAPSIATQTTTITSGGITVGQQFAFNYLPASVSDVIDGYWLYRTNVHSTPGISARWKFVKASVQNSGVYTCVDSSGVSTNFYYVSSVNKQGLESSLTDAAAGSGGTTGTFRPSTSTVISGGGYSNPSNVWDGNSSSSANGASSSGAHSMSWAGWASGTGTNTTTLYITSQVNTISGQTFTAKLEYSKDGGSTWTVVYSVSNSSRAKTTDTVSIPVATNMNQVQIRATITPVNGGSGTHLIFESWIQTT